MYCKNCGNLMDDQAAFCVKCGVAKGMGNNYCQNCGRPVNPGAVACTMCGAPCTPPVNPAVQKSKLVAGLLGIFLGAWGVHNFYLGNNGKATAQLLVALIGSLFFGLGLVAAELWALVETVQILTDKIDADANNFKTMTFAEELAKAQNK